MSSSSLSEKVTVCNVLQKGHSISKEQTAGLSSLTVETFTLAGNVLQQAVFPHSICKDPY